jgi:hypothetical protein
MGTRFLLVRLESDPNIAGSAFDHSGAERSMREELREAVRGLLENLPGQAHDKAFAREPIIALANYVAKARSPVDRDSQGEVRLVLDPEAPTRIVKMLAQLWRASGLLGLDGEASWAVVRRVGVDSIPKLRRAVLDYLADESQAASTTDVAGAVEHPSRTTRRALEDLVAHGVVTRIPGGEGRADLWELTEQTRGWLDRMTLPVSSVGERTPTNPFMYTKTAKDDITGKVPASIHGCSCECHGGSLPAMGCVRCWGDYHETAEASP